MQRVYRLRSDASFRYVYRHGTAVSSALMTLIFVNASSIKIGVSVSKKVGKSVVRSRVKRRIKENFRALIPALTVKCNYVIAAKPPAAEASYAEIGGELKRLLKRVNHYRNA